MIHGLTFKEYVEEEKQKLGEMSKEEKIDYFKEYYLKMVIFAVIVLILLIWLLIDVGLGFRGNVVTGGVVNTKLSEEGSLFLSDEYMTYLNASKLTKKVDLAPDIFIDDDDPQSYTIFQAELATNTYNYLITDEKGLAFATQLEVVANLDEVLESDLSQKLSDKIVYRKSGDNGTEIAAAIEITDTAFTKNYVNSGGKVYFVITGNPDEYGKALKMLEYILEKK